MGDPSPRAGLVSSTFTGLTSQSISVAVHGVLHLGVLAVLARLLTPQDYGLVGMATVFVGLANIFSQLGVGPAIVQRPVLTRHHVRVGFTLSLLLGAGTTLALWLGAPAVAHFFRDERVTSLLRGISLTFVFTSLGVVAEGLLQRELKYGRLMWVNIASYAGGYAVPGILLAALGHGPWALVGAAWGQSLVRSLMTLGFRPHSLVPSLARAELRELTRAGGGFTLARVFNYAATNGDYAVVGRLAGSAALGLYTRAYQLMLLPVANFATVISKVLFPVIARLQHDREGLRAAYLRGSAVIALVTTPLSALLVVTAHEFVLVFLGARWTGAIGPFQVLAAGILFRASYVMGDSLARGTGAMYRRSVRDAIYAALVVAGSWLGLRYGLTGVAGGVLVAVFVNYVLSAEMSLRQLDCRWSEYLACQAPGALLALVAAAAAFPAHLTLRSAGAPAWVILVLSSLAGAAAAGTLVLARPAVLGSHGGRALRQFTDFAAPRMGPFRDRLGGRRRRSARDHAATAETLDVERVPR